MLPTTKRRKNELTSLVFVPESKSMSSLDVMALYMLMWRSIVPVVSQRSQSKHS